MIYISTCSQFDSRLCHFSDVRNTSSDFKQLFFSNKPSRAVQDLKVSPKWSELVLYFLPELNPKSIYILVGRHCTSG